ncbi:hypothetical protein EOD39_6418 [Acipenser ruthenus]|uniref:Uncharacterized protein n=1 Tax=Acipenser ruthenus TaxID=7906 RepID=A0A444UA77_ACIRT|nr:hypothetical protein EOD39_6418 [Acipenser ruthenus]
MSRKKETVSPHATPDGKRFKQSSLLEEMTLVIERALAAQSDVIRSIISGMLSEALGPLNKVIQDLMENLNIHIKTVEKLTSAVDAVKADMRQAKREVNDCMQLVDKFQDKLNDPEDRSRRCNV